ncbi:hypothetical protein BGX27_007859 [Mortierella sp. AM989]|nr:hypothetical protein BGX27_007859 [Mortierella sp. AM989]
MTELAIRGGTEVVLAPYAESDSKDEDIKQIKKRLEMYNNLIMNQSQALDNKTRSRIIGLNGTVLVLQRAINKKGRGWFSRWTEPAMYMHEIREGIANLDKQLSEILESSVKEQYEKNETQSALTEFSRLLEELRKEQLQIQVEHIQLDVERPNQNKMIENNEKAPSNESIKNGNGNAPLNRSMIIKITLSTILFTFIIVHNHPMKAMIFALVSFIVFQLPWNKAFCR